MNMTIEQAASAIVGKYTIWDVVTVTDLDRWHMVLNDFIGYMFAREIAPCPVCGAYRREDTCEVCEKAREL